MNGKRRTTVRIRTWMMAALACGLCAGPVAAQDKPDGAVPAYAQSIIEGKTQPADPNVVQSSCCGNLSPAPMITDPIGCSSGQCPPGCPTGHCFPGQKCPNRYGGCSSCGGGGGCSSCGGGGGDDEDCGKCTRLCSNLFSCFCCPDPCYEGQWYPTANAAMFVDHARPQSQMLLRWDAGLDMTMPDRNEFFWAKIGGKGPANRENSLDYHELNFYNETAVGAFGAFVEMPYRLLETDNNGFHAGWGDMNIGTKTMFVDCELMQLTFQFRTWIPIGSAPHGFGTGHVTLEPSLLSAIKLTPTTWLESQFSEWIPIAGDNDYAGMILHCHASLNHLWWQKKAFQFISTLEYQSYIFQDGALTNPADFVGPVTQKSSREAYHYLGPGFRLVMCDRYDLGFGAAFSLTEDGYAQQIYRTEFRIRY